mmetsp:Transcript_298/g.824  ORF Transcript_298/g.824 Transcript_298/m.824 type:complete len:389 (-) Transcript_298:138-1304(-)
MKAASPRSASGHPDKATAPVTKRVRRTNAFDRASYVLSLLSDGNVAIASKTEKTRVQGNSMSSSSLVPSSSAGHFDFKVPSLRFDSHWAAPCMIRVQGMESSAMVKPDSLTIGPNVASHRIAFTPMYGWSSKKLRDAIEAIDKARCVMRSWLSGVSGCMPSSGSDSSSSSTSMASETLCMRSRPRIIAALSKGNMDDRWTVRRTSIAFRARSLLFMCIAATASRASRLPRYPYAKVSSQSSIKKFSIFLMSCTSCRFCALLMALTTSSAVDVAVSLDIAVECSRYSLPRLLTWLLLLPSPPGRRPFRLPALVFLLGPFGFLGLFFLARSFAFRSARESFVVFWSAESALELLRRNIELRASLGKPRYRGVMTDGAAGANAETPGASFS